jgi:hypothetical protein
MLRPNKIDFQKLRAEMVERHIAHRAEPAEDWTAPIDAVDLEDLNSSDVVIRPVRAQRKRLKIAHPTEHGIEIRIARLGRHGYS